MGGKVRFIEEAVRVEAMAAAALRPQVPAAAALAEGRGKMTLWLRLLLDTPHCPALFAPQAHAVPSRSVTPVCPFPVDTLVHSLSTAQW